MPLVLKVQPSKVTSVPPQVQMEYWLSIVLSKVQLMKVALPYRVSLPLMVQLR